MSERDDSKKGIDRRTFLSESARSGAALAGMALVPGLLSREALAGDQAKAAAASDAASPAAELPEISVVKGPDPYACTVKAIEQLGGMSTFVKKGDRVALLTNSWGYKPGAYTKPEITLAVAQLCFDAGAKQVVTVKDVDEDYWELCEDAKKYRALIARIEEGDTEHRDVEVEGKVLKEAGYKDIGLDFEVLINLPIAKHHSGCLMTGALKNMMGMTSLGTNVGFHLGDSPVSTLVTNIGNSFPLPDHFGQCVADLYDIRRPNLVVLDAHEILLTNGPSGPGKLGRPREVIAGTDPVAIDALACAHLGRKTSEIYTLTKAHETGVGEIDPSKRRIQRTELA